MVAVPKVRQAAADPSIRDVQITDQGMTIAHPVLAATGLLTGRATPVQETNRDDTRRNPSWWPTTNPLICQVIGDLLGDEGYDVLCASSGRGMLEVLATEQPDLVLLDLMMPDRDGWEALRTMHAHPQWRAIPVVIVSVGVGPDSPDGVSVSFLTKPFDLEQMLEAVTQAIGHATEPEPS